MLKELVDMIKEEFKTHTGKNNRSIGLPTDYNYSISEKTIYLYIKKPSDNMQKDTGAFDAWGLVIKRWIPRITNIVLTWDKPEKVEDSNYQRFLYRVKKSTSIYDWLEVDNKCKHLLDNLLIEDQGKYVVNFPTQEASNNPKNIEVKREYLFSSLYNCQLSQVAGMDQDKIYRQLPVGIYKDKKATINERFPGRAATIDLWGLNELKKELHLFELKAKSIKNESKNTPMGIYSQLFFYTMIQDDLIKGFFKVDNPENSDYRGFKYLTNYGYENINSIRSHFLVDEIHPLMDSAMIDIINMDLKAKGKDIKFDIIKYEIDETNTSIKLFKLGEEIVD